MPLPFFLSTLLLPALASAPLPLAAQTPEITLTTLTCGTGPDVPEPTQPLPDLVTGRVAFYAERFDARTLAPVAAVGLDADRVVPLASAYKTLVAWSVLRDVDAGRLNLSTRVTSTPANRSIEGYSRGTNALGTLLERSIVNSENTAADILHRATGVRAVADLAVRAGGPCVRVETPNKAYWAAQAGQLPQLFPALTRTELRASAEAQYALPRDARLERSRALTTAALNVDPDALRREVDAYFKSDRYDPQVDTLLFNNATPRSFTDALKVAFTRNDLKVTTNRTFRNVMAQGCCRPKAPTLKFTYWGAKAGSGWRLLTLSGYVELPDGGRVAYLYANTDSDASEDAEIEAQIRPVVQWIDGVLADLVRAK
ncbi:serine hydrolase [Deinococcus maricopensis]|uniref:Beta-lactamase, putative n=1 Tax=Deinococcus maricopensis (strain DSM 21211 / LMG 22137 / NRRL B-23946 / LB-34) TaxID=709986 RepID=E8UB48_DEIML|nr:serine hydrolase [Deinococcus maricopensis]ADV68287.1 beta-lactamase, putative [Deinococcus maricopensis DSM 21211]